MAQRYSVTPHPIESLLTWVKSGEIAIPEIQRPFVWEATKVRNLLDSLYQGYPVGYLQLWNEPDAQQTMIDWLVAKKRRAPEAIEQQAITR